VNLGPERGARATAASLFALMAAAVVAAVVVLRPFADRAEAGGQLTAAVTRRVVVQTVQLRGGVSTVAQAKVPATVSVRGRLTALNVARGQTVRPGMAVLAIDRRPVFLLQGSAPAQRDLRPGDTGGDVSQLQNALARLSLYSGEDPPGTFGAATKEAVRTLYTRAGYNAPTTGGADGLSDRQSLQDAQAAVTAAQRVVTDAQALVDADPAAPTAAATLRNAQAALDRATTVRATVVARTGPIVPAAEVTYLPTAPARTLSVTGKVGDAVTAPPVTLAYGAVTVTAAVTPELASPVAAGQKVTIVSATTAAQSQGVVASIGKPTTDQTSGLTTVVVTVTPAKALDDSWSGRRVRLDVQAGRTPQPVLAVPVGALFTAPDGKVEVSRVDADGTARPVPVRLGMSGDGFAAVEPGAGSLDEGDHVLIGP
jgi:peptidoglycan hydrolase-like protein with peptidoglycan-binding domain